MLAGEIPPAFFLTATEHEVRGQKYGSQTVRLLNLPPVSCPSGPSNLVPLQLTVLKTQKIFTLM